MWDGEGEGVNEDEHVFYRRGKEGADDLLKAFF
jgi:hypothetical protein